MKSLTITVSCPEFFRHRYGIRKSDHAPVKALMAVMATIGVDRGRMMREKMLTWFAPSMEAASK